MPQLRGEAPRRERRLRRVPRALGGAARLGRGRKSEELKSAGGDIPNPSEPSVVQPLHKPETDPRTPGHQVRKSPNLVRLDLGRLVRCALCDALFAKSGSAVYPDPPSSWSCVELLQRRASGT